MRTSEQLPFGLEWEVEPRAWNLDGEALTVVTAGSTDNFVDPAGSVVVLNSARALAVAPRPGWQFSARVAVNFQAEYDAGVLMLWSDQQHFAKLCFERSPHGEAMVVSVVTRGLSDDANGWIVDAGAVWLRISCIADGVYAFHARGDGSRWDIVRYFELSGSAPMKYGLAAQSPVGAGCTVTFTQLAFRELLLQDLRDGS
jgi:regulation of enolase protein 1 (concanavalin A-like superfamily)